LNQFQPTRRKRWRLTRNAASVGSSTLLASKPPDVPAGAKHEEKLRELITLRRRS
jgi:hypothetical protein